MMRTRLLLTLLVALSACGDDGVHHLADAPPQPIDAPADAAPDAPDPKVSLNITVSGTGGGMVTSSPAGISCTTASCSAEFDPDTVVTLTAVPNTGSVFVSWGGACTGTMPTCDVTLAQAASVTATFDIARYAVTVTKSGAGMGVVAGNGLACGATCTVMVDHGTMLSLTATPASLSVFAGWGGACSGQTTCMVQVTGPTAITANFALDDVTLFVTKGGNGAGTVTATGINCGADCMETYTAGQMVTLTAAASTGSTFTGWSGGGCTGTSTCTLTMTAATTVTATFTLDKETLTVTKPGNGAGSVVSNPAGIACGADCTEDYDYNTMVVLTATPSTGSTFTGWTGACTGTLMCTVTMTAAKNVAATFTLQQFALNVNLTGAGTVTSAPAGITCPTDCTQNYNYGQMVTLTAAASTGSTFAGWSGGGCTGTAPCTVTVTAATTVAASFTLNQYTLTVNKGGMGTGTVSATGIACGADCSETYNFGTVVTLTASAATGSTFVGWSGGGCSGTGSCVVTISAATTVTATFDLQQFALNVTKPGNGTGTVTSAPAGISCGADCSENYNYNTPVTLTAAASTGSTFTGWGGACSGTGSCVVTMDQARTVTATFTLMTFALDVTRSGGGSGSVSSSPSGIACPTDCNQSYDYNTIVTLTASPSSGSLFAGWSGGGCTGTGSCSVTMTAAATVNAKFDLATFDLTVTPSGLGTGAVVSDIAGINCGVDCSETYTSDKVVTLTATANATTSTFAGWSGAGCTGTGTCVVTMTQARTVTAQFDLKQFTLRVNTNGDGVGTVTGNGVSCPGTCSVQIAYGTSVTLTGTPGATVSTLSTFSPGWNNGTGSAVNCTGTGTCTFTMTSASTIIGGFKMKSNIIFTSALTTTGDFAANTNNGVAQADALCNQAAVNKGLTGKFRAYISGHGVNAIDRINATGASGWVRVDAKPVMNDISQFGGGTLFNAPFLDEGGADLSNSNSPRVWTASKGDGTDQGQNCNAANTAPDWSNLQSRTGTGLFSAVDSTVVTGGGTRPCGEAEHLYCLQVDRKAVAQ